MYKQHKDGSIYTVYGLDCNLPPEGMVYNHHSGELEYVGVYQRSGIKAEQYWERPKEPENYKQKERNELIKKKRDPSFFDSELNSYKAQEWKRRLYGFWFMNNGKPTYITGLNYFYLAHWQIDIGYPDFRIPDMEFFYFLQYCIDDPRCLGMIELTKRRQGKCLGINELVRMFDGSLKRAKEVLEGDLLMGINSQPRKVISTTSGVDEMYEVRPLKGDSFTCNGDHILHCVLDGGKKTRNISVNDYFKLSEPTRKRLKMIRSGYDLPEKNLPIDPYFLGLWLGDGSSKSLEIYNEDEEVIDYLKNFAKEKGLKYHNYGENNLRHSLGKDTRVRISGKYKGEEYSFSSKREFMKAFGYAEKGSLINCKGIKNKVYKEGDWTVKKETNEVRDQFNALNLLGNKHIPEIYLKGSINQRLELLAGILDADGTCIKGGKSDFFQIAQTSKRIDLVYQIKQLASSCGLSVTGSYSKDKKSYCVRIFGDVHNIPTKIKRKQAKNPFGKYNSLICGFSVESIGTGEYAGFTLDGDHLFLLSDGTVTHNSARSGVFLFEYISRNKRAWGGIQSKTLEDAKQNVFSGFVVSPFKQLKSFFRPVYDTDQGTTPKKELRFYKPNKRGQVSLEDEDKEELESTIDYKSAELFAYDGKKLQRYVGDEVGKTKSVDVSERHSVVQYCLQLDGEIIGKALYTTTVEDMDNGGEAFMNLWNDSDPEERDQNGRTKSGLYRYFLPAYKTLFYDDYGFPDEEKGKEYYLNTREGLQKDSKQLASAIRKNPFTVEEAFRVDGDECMFDAIKLQNAIDSVSWMEESEILVRGNFLWEDSKRDSNVIFVPSKNGKFLLNKELDLNDSYNVVEQMGTKKKPMNTTKFVAGADPYDHDITVDSRNSNGAAYVYRKFDANDSLSETFVCQYLFRPNTADIFYEDMIKMCHFFGCKVLPEDNKIGMIKYFQYRGYERFLMKLPNANNVGINANKKTHQQLAEELEWYVYERCDSIKYKDLLNDLIRFDINKTTKFDAAMAAGWTLVAAGGRKYEKKPEKKKMIELREYFR